MEELVCNALKFIVPKELHGMIVAKGKLIVELMPDEDKTKGGIMLHSFSKPAHQKGVVVLTGEAKGAPLVDMGAVVLVDKVLGKECQINGKTFYIFEAKGIFAVIGHTDGEGAIEIYGNRNIR
jgi:co-chaperonin GroES (HSP10)